ncbi:MAG TPA: hydantoinase/oxoprolinase N-terminal domain-containing protein, partial [Thermoanaerobaculia bacterium]
MAGPPWRLRIDTGGTFTDCLAVDPAGRLHRAKVLSSSALRGRIAERLSPSAVRVEAGWRVPPGFFRGFAFRLLDADHPPLEAVGWEGAVLTLDHPLPPGDLAGTACELRSPEEAPVLAARLVTGTPMGEDLPEIALRLATTRGTNALLERKGAPTALFITRGFADLLSIGTQQRPDLFALDIRKPEPLYAEVVEVPERLAADGSVLHPLDPEPMREAAVRLVAQGIRSAAVALMHGYRNPSHEEQMGEILRSCGLRSVSLSSHL